MSFGDFEAREQRERYRKKLDELIAVLSLATDQVKRKLKSEGLLDSDRIRLQSMLRLIESAMATCQQAHSAIVAAQLHCADIEVEPESGRPISPRSELTEQDLLRVRRLPPIRRDDLYGVDFDELSKLL